ncbi:putative SpoU rRNA Methylase family [Trypanosoma vivax]|nr:putative SpoU rRNA Methylase family [Trypanosoma vivax]
MNTTLPYLRHRLVRPRVVQEISSLALEAHSKGHEWKAPLVLRDLDAVVQLSPSVSLSGRQLWNSTRLLRENRHARLLHKACVVGGAEAIRRIWREYKVKPNVVYVPDVEPGVATWCLEDELATCIIRCPPADVNRHLLNTEFGDGFAAEFPAPTFPTLEMFMGEGRLARLASMLVLVGLRIPSNVGVLIRAAADLGFEGVLLDDCVDVLNEKTLRASGGAAFSSKIKLFTTSGASISLLSTIAMDHQLVPLLAVPSQGAESAFEVAKTLHASNAAVRQQSCSDPTGRVEAPRCMGPLLILGSESQGLKSLAGEWPVPHRFVSIPHVNSTIKSVNVGVAGSVLMHAFRPAAEKHYAHLSQLNAGKGSNLARVGGGDATASPNASGEGQVADGTRTGQCADS